MHSQNALKRALNWMALLNILISAMFLKPFIPKQSINFTYAGLNYPLQLPIGQLDAVDMTILDSMNFQSDDAQAVRNWRSVDAYIPSNGWIRLGPNYRMLNVAIFHELHCVRRLFHGLYQPNHPFSNAEHINHCLAYIKQHILCIADDSLEAGDTMARDFETDVVQGEAVCEDWGKVFDFLGDNSAAWWGSPEAQTFSTVLD